LTVDDVESVVSEEYSFNSEVNDIEEETSQMMVKNVQGHLYKIFLASIVLIKKHRVSERRTDGVFHISFEVSCRFLDVCPSKVKQCISCRRDLGGSVFTHQCQNDNCGYLNCYHWTCFKIKLACQLKIEQPEELTGYLVKCDSCREALFRNHALSLI